MKRVTQAARIALTIIGAATVTALILRWAVTDWIINHDDHCGIGI